MNRAQRRKLGIKKKPDLEKKIGLFDKLPDHCTNCLCPYDKKDKKMAMTWSVVVREKEGKVNLYCPKCWDEMGDDKILKLSKKVPQFKNKYNEEGLVYYGIKGTMENVLHCKTFCKAMEAGDDR